MRTDLVLSTLESALGQRITASSSWSSILTEAANMPVTTYLLVYTETKSPQSRLTFCLASDQGHF